MPKRAARLVRTKYEEDYKEEEEVPSQQLKRQKTRNQSPGSLEPHDSDEPENQVHGFPMHVGKAIKDDPKIKQPPAAEAGIVPKVAFRWIFSGPSNSGKTNLARWVLDNMYQASPGKSFFDRIYLFSPTAKLDPVWKNLVGLKDSDRVTELDQGGKEKLLEVFNGSIKKTKALGKEKAPHTLVIIDDGIADVKFLNSRGFMKSFIAGRHGNISTFMLTQSYNKVPRTARIQATALSMFPSKTTEIERLWEEHGPLNLGKWDFVDMVKYAIHKTEEEKYPFLFIDTDKPEDERFRRCFYEVLIPNPSQNDISSSGARPAYSQRGAHAAASASRPPQSNQAQEHERYVSDAEEPNRRRRRRPARSRV